MSEEQRRDRLRRAADRVGGKAALGRLLGYKDGHFVGQMLNGSRPITEKTLRALLGVREVADLFAWYAGAKEGASMGFVMPANDEDQLTPTAHEQAREVKSDVVDAEVTRAPREISLLDNPDYPAVRRVQLKLSAGVSGFAVEYLEEDGPPIVFRRDWFVSHGYRPEKMLALTVRGTSMEPTLYDGDLVVVNTAQTQPRDARAFAINYEGELVIKRLVNDAGQWLMRSDNPDKLRYPDKRMYEGALLIGEVVYKQSERV